MTGTFGPAPVKGQCPFSNCQHSFTAGELVYLFRHVSPVCLDCAKTRWGYEPSSDQPRTSSSTPTKTALGFDSTKAILKQLQAKANANDPKSKAAGQ